MCIIKYTFLIMLQIIKIQLLWQPGLEQAGQSCLEEVYGPGCCEPDSECDSPSRYTMAASDRSQYLLCREAHKLLFHWHEIASLISWWLHIYLDPCSWGTTFMGVWCSPNAHAAWVDRIQRLFLCKEANSFWVIMKIHVCTVGTGWKFPPCKKHPLDETEFQTWDWQISRK